MRKYFIGILALCIGAFVANAQPKLDIIGGMEHNWGKVSPKDSPLKTKVKLKNVGNEQLLITNVKPSCGCTTAPLDKDKLAPGETATLDVTFNVGSNAGVNRKTITISTNDPNNSRVIYKLSADVQKAITISPTRYFPFNRLEVGESSSSTLKIKNTSNKVVTLSDFDVTPKNLKINLSGKKSLQPGESIDLTATITPDKPGYMNCKVTMKTSVPDEKTISISGYGNVKESPVFNNK